QNGIRVRAILIGQGPQRRELERRSVALDVADRVTFTGAKPQTELPHWYRAADLFVLPSRSEGVPNVLLEASACSIPWVATRVGGVPEIARLGASRLVPSEDVNALATAIRETLASPLPAPASGPRDRHEAVAELAEFLQSVLDPHAKRSS